MGMAILPPVLALTLNHGMEIGLPATAGLAAVSLIGYLLGKRTRQADLATQNAQRQQELDRASGIAQQLESIADELRKELTSHHGRLTKFRRRLCEAQQSRDDATWKQLCHEAESMLLPTMELAEQLSLAYDAIRQQSDSLETFTHDRIDRLTGVGNARALEARLEVLLSAAERTGGNFSVELVSIDRDSSAEDCGDEPVSKSPLPAFARLIESCMRESDYVARYSSNEFVVVMPQTRLAGACVFGERLQRQAVEQLAETVSSGIAESQAGDDARSLLGRADSAFYSAKAAGGNRQFVHTGSHIREHHALESPRPMESTLPATVLSGIPPLDGAGDFMLSAAAAAAS